MIQKKRLQLCGLACLLGALVFSPSAEAFAGWKNAMVHTITMMTALEI